RPKGPPSRCRLPVADVVQRNEIVAARFPREIHGEAAAGAASFRDNPFASAQLARDVVLRGVGDLQPAPQAGIERLRLIVFVDEHADAQTGTLSLPAGAPRIKEIPCRLLTDGRHADPECQLL